MADNSQGLVEMQVRVVSRGGKGLVLNTGSERVQLRKKTRSYLHRECAGTCKRMSKIDKIASGVKGSCLIRLSKIKKFRANINKKVKYAHVRQFPPDIKNRQTEKHGKAMGALTHLRSCTR